MSLESYAQEFATKAHGCQVRKYTGEPYIAHPAAVVQMLKRTSHTEEMLAAAWLHDVVEDTPVTLDEIGREFGTTVAHYVWFLTDVSRPEDGNRAARKAKDLLHISGAPSEAQTIKLADLIDNTSSILAHDPKFAKVYLAEKAKLLEVLTRADPDLWHLAQHTVSEGLLTLDRMTP